MGKREKKRSLTAVDLGQLPVGFHRRRFGTGEVGFEAFIWKGAASGPVLLVNGATHGDEYEGPTLLCQWAQDWRPKTLRGTVVMVPVLNEVAFYAGARCRPDDGANLARSFPGQPGGTPTQQLAWLFDQHLLSQCTHYIDLHSAGGANELDPWAGYIHSVTPAVDKTQRQMTACFDRFWGWAGPYLPGRTISAAALRQIPAIYTECRGAGDVAARDLKALDLGLRRVLLLLKLVAGAKPALRKQRLRMTKRADETHLQVHHQAPFDGVFVPAIDLRQVVRKGQAIGQMLALSGQRAVILAEDSGRVVMRRIQRSTRKGDALAVIAKI